MLPFYYVRVMEKCEFALIDMFNNLRVNKYDDLSRTTFSKTINVPIVTHTDKNFANWYRNTHLKKKPVPLPIAGLRYDSKEQNTANRTQATYCRNIFSKATEQWIQDIQPTPYYLYYTLEVLMDNKSDFGQITENIVPYFNTFRTLRIREFDFAPDIERKVPVYLVSVEDKFEDELEAGSQHRYIRAIFKFRLEVDWYRPFEIPEIIKYAELNINLDQFTHSLQVFVYPDPIAEQEKKAWEMLSPSTRTGFTLLKTCARTLVKCVNLDGSTFFKEITTPDALRPVGVPNFKLLSLNFDEDNPLATDFSGFDRDFVALNDSTRNFIDPLPSFEKPVIGEISASPTTSIADPSIGSVILSPNTNIEDNDVTTESVPVALTGVISGDIKIVMDIEHDDPSQLKVELKSPSGVIKILHNNLHNIEIDGLYDDFDGESVVGTWEIIMTDNTVGGVGTLNRYEIYFSLDGETTESIPVVLTGSIYQGIKVSIDVTHADPTNLKIDLISPIGTTVNLHDKNASVAIDNITLNDFDGEDVTGTWKISILDDANGDIGVLDRYSIDFSPDAGSETEDGYKVDDAVAWNKILNWFGTNNGLNESPFTFSINLQFNDNPPVDTVFQYLKNDEATDSQGNIIPEGEVFFDWGLIDSKLYFAFKTYGTNALSYYFTSKDSLTLNNTDIYKFIFVLYDNGYEGMFGYSTNGGVTVALEAMRE